MIEGVYYGLTRPTHELFVQCSSKDDRDAFSSAHTHDAYRSVLAGISCHTIYPPILFTTSSLAEGILHMHPLMSAPTSRQFEGCFVISEDNTVVIPNYDVSLYGFKWKTGNHEEQPQMPSVEKMGLTDSQHIDLYDKLKQVFVAKTKDPVSVLKIGNPKGATGNAVDPVIMERIEVAFQRELGKIESFEDVPKKERSVIAPTLKTSITKAVDKNVMSMVMKI